MVSCGKCEAWFQIECVKAMEDVENSSVEYDCVRCRNRHLISLQISTDTNDAT